MALLPVQDALERICKGFAALESEVIPLVQALGRTTAEPLIARLTQPPFDASAMDGYAVLARDIADCPVELTVIGEAPAGGGFGETVGTGEAVRIFTGGVLPVGTDTVVIQENVEILPDGRIRVLETASLGKNIRKQGNDFAEGDVLVEKGVRLTSRHLGLLAAANVAYVPVSRKPRVALLATGDELVTVGDTVGPNQIVSSNSVLLSTLIMEQGGEVVDLGIARDNEESLRVMADQVKDVDLFITIGGASVGDHDLVQKVLGEEGLEVDFWKVAMRPGKPLIFGKFRDIPMLGLPGNPASAYVCAAVFLLPALHILMGRQSVGAEHQLARLKNPLPANGPRQHYMRARVEFDDQGRLTVKTATSQDSAKLSTLSGANCLAIRAPHAPEIAPGDMVPVLILPS
ncbi:gephyrin-like molybdotransferase Glp [Emcibacter nanhaiensis]|uniref:Molybdopterin molybdenumtransferase n=1 Tax=Emcibacter nanhaiensis TaxID=1505037 RepID=A0A501PT82_9PROT|nr:gephyrin-like molybdotransferase Glp [Emcibacter nanhaiensis]TPD62921.1 molybdopterin molybdotransferase MoeA [Emcibacter nanhaiensis]